MKRLALPVSVLLTVCLSIASASGPTAGNQCPADIRDKDPLQGINLLAPIDEVVVVWDKGEPKKPVAKLYDVLPTDQLLGKGWLFDPYSDLAHKRTLDVATGDFNNDQREEMAWIWQSDRFEPGSLILRILQADDDLQLSLACAPRDTSENIYGNAHIAVVTGDFDSDSSHEIAVSWQGADRKTNVKLYDVDGQLCPQPMDKKSDEILGSNTEEWLDVAAGDFDADGKDEVVLLWERGSRTANLKFYDVDPSLTLLPGTSTMVSSVAGGEHMAIAAGDMDGDHRAEIVVAWEEGRSISETETKVLLGLAVYSLQPTAAGADSLTWVEQARKLFTDDMVDRMADLAIATGDIDGKGDDEIVVSFAGTDAMVHTFVVDFVKTGFDWQLEEKDRNKAQVIQGAKHLDLTVGQFDDRDLQHEVVLALEADQGWVCLKFYDIDGFRLKDKHGLCEEPLGGTRTSR